MGQWLIQADCGMQNDSSLMPFQTTDPDLIEEICRFRVRVWSETGHLATDLFPNDTWRDPLDDHCTHLAIRQAGELVAAARWSLHPSLGLVPESEQYVHLGVDLPGPIAVPERIVVDPRVPYLNLAGRLLDKLDELAIASGARCSLAQASPDMIRLLQLRNRCRVLGEAARDPRFPRVRFFAVVREY